MTKIVPHQKQKKKVKYTINNMKRDLEQISKEITEWEFDYILGINRGGLVPAVYLSHILDKPLGSIDWSLRDGRNPAPDGKELSFSTMSHLNQGKKILLVDDIIDDGDTIFKLLESWAQRGTNLSGLKLFCLHYNKNNRRGIEPHYYCNEHSPSNWISYDWEI